MTDAGEESVLILEARGPGWADALVWGGLTAVFSAFGIGVVVARFRVGPPLSQGEVVAHLLGAALICLVWPTLFPLAWRFSPRGTWRIDNDGVVHTPGRGGTVAVRWKDVERVHWVHNCVALRSATTTLRIPVASFPEAARVPTLRRLEAILACDFDLSWHPIPHPLDGVEPAWWQATLRFARVLAAGLGGFALLAVPMFWVFRRDPVNLGHAQAVLFGCVGLMIVWLFAAARAELRLNPTWRGRRVKIPVADL